MTPDSSLFNDRDQGTYDRAVRRLRENAETPHPRDWNQTNYTPTREEADVLLRALGEKAE